MNVIEEIEKEIKDLIGDINIEKRWENYSGEKTLLSISINRMLSILDRLHGYNSERR